MGFQFVLQLLCSIYIVISTWTSNYICKQLRVVTYICSLVMCLGIFGYLKRALVLLEEPGCGKFLDIFCCLPIDYPSASVLAILSNISSLSFPQFTLSAPSLANTAQDTSLVGWFLH